MEGMGEGGGSRNSKYRSGSKRDENNSKRVPSARSLDVFMQTALGRLVFSCSEARFDAAALFPVECFPRKCPQIFVFLFLSLKYRELKRSTLCRSTRRDQN